MGPARRYSELAAEFLCALNASTPLRNGQRVAASKRSCLATLKQALKARNLFLDFVFSVHAPPICQVDFGRSASHREYKRELLAAVAAIRVALPRTIRPLVETPAADPFP